MEKKNGSALLPFTRANVSPDTEVEEADDEPDDEEDELHAARAISTGKDRAPSLISDRFLMSHSSPFVVKKRRRCGHPWTLNFGLPPLSARLRERATGLAAAR